MMTFGVPNKTGGPMVGLRYAQEMVVHGHTVIALCGSHPSGHESIVPQLKAAGVEVHIEEGFRKFFNRRLLDKAVAIVREHSVECVVSVLQVDLKVAAWTARKCGVPSIAFVLNKARFFGNWPMRWIKRLGYRFTLAHAVDRVIACSVSVAHQHLSEFAVASERMETIDNGVDLDRFPLVDSTARKLGRQTLGVAEDEILVMNVGRLDPQKGQDLLLTAICDPRLRDRRLKLVLVGDLTTYPAPNVVAYAQSLRDTAAQLGNRVTFAGWRENIPNLLAAADLYVHSARWEGLPLAVLEAMAARVPTVFTDCAGNLGSFVSGVHGTMVAKESVTALADGMVHMLELSDNDRLRIGQNGRYLVEQQFNNETSAKRFVQAIETVVCCRAGLPHKPSIQSR